MKSIPVFISFHFIEFINELATRFLYIGSDVLVLVGDDKQLPPTIKSKVAKQLSDTTFSRLRASGHPVYLLDTQYRMHPCISEFPSMIFYEGKLKNGVPVRDRPTPMGFPWPNKTKPLAFVTTPKDTREQGSRSKKNVKEGEIVKHVVDAVLRAGDLHEEQIGIVTPYSAQVCSFSCRFNNTCYALTKRKCSNLVRKAGKLHCAVACRESARFSINVDKNIEQ